MVGVNKTYCNFVYYTFVLFRTRCKMTLFQVTITLASSCCIHTEGALNFLYFASTRGEDERLFFDVRVGESTLWFAAWKLHAVILFFPADYLENCCWNNFAAWNLCVGLFWKAGKNIHCKEKDCPYFMFPCNCILTKSTIRDRKRSKKLSLSRSHAHNHFMVSSE